MLTLTKASCSTLQISGSILDTIIANPDDYVKVVITSTINCCHTEYEQEYEADEIESVLSLGPAFYNQTTTNLSDGVYKIKIRATLENGSWIQEEGCMFFDCATKCMVATHITGLLKDDPVATNIHMAHYGLTNDGNCGCNCDDLCSLYTHLLYLLNNKTTDCGC